RLLQAKHFADQNRVIAIEELLGGNRFDLKKYFESYMQIRGNFAGELELILCTNIKLKFQNSNIPRLLGITNTRRSKSYRNVNLYFEPIPDNDDIFWGERFRLVSGRYRIEREEVVSKLKAHFESNATKYINKAIPVNKADV